MSNPFHSSKLATAAGDLLISAFALTLCILSFIADKAEAHLFPRILAVIMLFLCIVQLIIVFRSQGDATQWQNIKQQLRGGSGGAAAIIIYVYCAEWLGFYAAGLLAFIAIALIGAKTRSKRELITAAGVGVAVVLVMYVLFSVLLRVQIPRGVLF